MKNKFLTLSQETQKSILLGAETKLNLPALIVEKDIWLCWLLDTVFQLPIAMSFKGGTSLSKAYKLIDRFSEDADITIDYHVFAPTLDLKSDISRSALKKQSEQLKIDLKDYITNIVCPMLHTKLANDFPHNKFKINISDDGEQVKVYYPTLFEQPESYLQNYVLLEFGGRNTTEPSEKYTITTLLSEATNDLDLPSATVNVLSPLRTFWEKATLIHVECHRDRLTSSAERLARHWYDLSQLNKSWVGEKALMNKSLLEDVIRHKRAFFNASYTHYDDCLNGNFKLIPNQNSLEGLKKDYFQMVNSGMFSRNLIDFKDILMQLAHLEKRINKLTSL